MDRSLEKCVGFIKFILGEVLKIATGMVYRDDLAGMYCRISVFKRTGVDFLVVESDLTCAKVDTMVIDWADYQRD